MRLGNSCCENLRYAWPSPERTDAYTIIIIAIVTIIIILIILIIIIIITGRGQGLKKIIINCIYV